MPVVFQCVIGGGKGDGGGGGMGQALVDMASW